MSLPLSVRTTVSTPNTLEAVATRLSAILSSKEVPHTAEVVDVDFEWSGAEPGEVDIILEWEIQ